MWKGSGPSDLSRNLFRLHVPSMSSINRTGSPDSGSQLLFSKYCMMCGCLHHSEIGTGLLKSLIDLLCTLVVCFE